MRCNARNCRNNEDGYCTCENYIEISAEGTCDNYYVPSINLNLHKKSDEYVIVNEDGSIKTFWVKGKMNPCECGSNCYHYRRKDGVVRGYCNACGSPIYEVKKEYYDEYLRNNRWKKVQDNGRS